MIWLQSLEISDWLLDLNLENLQEIHTVRYGLISLTSEWPWIKMIQFSDQSVMMDLF